MDGHNGSKINRLLKIWPRGTIAVYPWLRKHGIYRQLADRYQKTAWFQRIGRGAFTRLNDKVNWTGGLYAIQEQLKRPIHAAGKTALQIQGYAHFLPLGKQDIVTLFGNDGARLPAWFQEYDWEKRIRYKMTNLFPSDSDLGMTKREIGDYSIRLSTPERAIMEVLYLVPQEESFEEARLLMEGLTTLRPRLVQTLLEVCNSVKVKRLFLFLAEASNHSWVNKLDLSKVNLGKGKRVIVQGGHLDSKYQIIVPKVGHGQKDSGEPA